MPPVKLPLRSRVGALASRRSLQATQHCTTKPENHTPPGDPLSLSYGDTGTYGDMLDSDDSDAESRWEDSPEAGTGTGTPNAGTGTGTALEEGAQPPWLAPPRHLIDVAKLPKLGSMPAYSEVYRLDPTSVLKTGPGVQLQEAAMMVYVSNRTSVPVPRVMAYGVDPGTGNNYIIMEHIEGEPLTQVWDALDQDQKASVTAQLQGIMQELRGHRQSFIGSLIMDLNPVTGVRTFRASGVTDNFFAKPFGPYFKEPDFVAILGDILRARCDDVWTRNVLIPMLGSLPMHSPMSVLTHGELDPKNISVSRDGRVTALLDWSQAGFYPSHWEYVKAHFGDLNQSFASSGMLEYILDERYDLELAVMLHARDVIW